MALSHPDNELRRKLWALADKWEAIAAAASANNGMFAAVAEEAAYSACAIQLRQALTYPEADEAEVGPFLIERFGKTADELADEAERGWPVEPPLSPADRSFDERGMSL